MSLEILYFDRQYRSWNVSVDLGDWSLAVEPPTISSSTKSTNINMNINMNMNINTGGHGASGVFNGFPIYYQSPDSPVTSQFHCIGETNAEPFYWKRKKIKVDMNWATRSCHFQFLCFDLETNQFVLHLPKQQNHFDTSWESQQTRFANQSADGYPFGLAIGGINTKWTHAAYPRLKWFPKINYDPPKNFYALPPNVTFIPFHSLAGFNPGHLVWDDFLPIYTLLHIFGLEHLDPLLMRYQLSEEEGGGLWAGCDWSEQRNQECETMLQKFAPLLVRQPGAIPITTQHSYRLHLQTTSHKSNLVCARHGLAGLGSLTDHGVSKGHGWEQQDYQTMYNQGRGGQLWRFRNFLFNHLNLPITTAPPPGPPYRIIVSEHSSKMGFRSLDFEEHIQALNSSHELHDIEIMRVRMKDFSLKEQAEMVREAAIYVTACGGGAVTATFLPRGASILVYYSEVSGVEKGKSTGKPARLDWDYFNNMAYVRVHWLTQPRNRLRILPEEISLFVELVKHEMELIRAQRLALDKKR